MMKILNVHYSLIYNDYFKVNIYKYENAFNFCNYKILYLFKIKSLIESNILNNNVYFFIPYFIFIYNFII